MNDANVIRISDEAEQALQLMCSLSDCGRSTITDVALRFMTEKFANSDSEVLNMIGKIKLDMNFQQRLTDTFEKVENK